MRLSLSVDRLDFSQRIGNMTLKKIRVFKYLGTCVIMGWLFLTMFLFYIGYWPAGIFTTIIAYDATNDLMDHWSEEMKLVRRSKDSK